MNNKKMQTFLGGIKRHKRVLIAVAFGALAGFSLYTMNMNLSDMELAMAQVQEDLTQTQDSLENASQKVTEVLVRQDLKAASKAGEEVATLQNAYKGLISVSVKPEEVAAYDANLIKLEEYFAQDSKDARLMWYMPDLNEIGDFVWSFSRPYDVSDEEVKVLWVAKDKLGAIVAYTTAKFDVKEAKFKDVVTKMTTVGGSYIGFTDTGKKINEVDVKEVGNMIDQINALGTSENPYSEETLQGVIETRMLYKEYYDRELKEKEEKERLERQKEKEGNTQ